MGSFPSLNPPTAGFDRVRMVSCEPQPEGKVLDIRYRVLDPAPEMGVLSVLVDFPNVPVHHPQPYPKSFKVRFPNQSTVYELELGPVLAVKGSAAAQKAGGNLIFPVSLPNSVYTSSETQFSWIFTLTTPIAGANQALMLYVGIGFRLRGGTCASAAVSIENCDSSVCERFSVDGSNSADWECTFRSDGWLKIVAKKDFEVSTLRLGAFYETPRIARGDSVVKIIKLLDATKPFQHLYPTDYLNDSNQRDYGEIPISVEAYTIFRPVHGGAPFKPGQTRAHTEIIFKQLLPVSPQNLLLGLPVSFRYSEQWDCAGKVSVPYPNVLNVDSCSAGGGESERQIGMFSTSTNNVTIADWLVATDIAVPMVAPEDLYIWYKWGNTRGTWERLKIPLNAVKGSKQFKLIGGDDLEPVMRPNSLDIGVLTEVSFIFKLSNAIATGGSLVITPPAEMSIAGAGCTDDSVNVGVFDISMNSNERVSAESASGVDWQCSKKGSNAIMVKRVNERPSSFALKVTFKMTLSTGNPSRKAGQASVMTCTNGDGCDSVNHAHYLGDSNYVDFGLTKNDVNVPETITPATQPPPPTEPAATDPPPPTEPAATQPPPPTKPAGTPPPKGPPGPLPGGFTSLVDAEAHSECKLNADCTVEIRMRPLEYTDKSVKLTVIQDGVAVDWSKAGDLLSESDFESWDSATKKFSLKNNNFANHMLTLKVVLKPSQLGEIGFELLFTNEANQLVHEPTRVNTLVRDS
eukprot:Filipodium_phascolosomae@DN2774_c0_g1_i12.p1